MKSIVRNYRFLLLLLTVLGGCAAVAPAVSPSLGATALPQPAAAPAVTALPPCDQLDDALSTRLSLARQALNSGKGYAALAYLDTLRSNTPEAQLLRADAERRIGRLDEAERIYQQLLKSCLAGYAYHGLGLIESARGHMSAALAFLEQAQALLPLNAPLRNDLGYLYMQMGNFPAARFAFMTAIELDPSDRRPLNNLVMTYARMGDLVAARRLAAQSGMTDKDLETLLAHVAQEATASTQGDKHDATQH